MASETYENPDYKPFSGNHSWVPSIPPATGNDVASGFSLLTIERGKYRNDIPFVPKDGTFNYTDPNNDKTGKGTVQIGYTGELTTEFDTLFSPFFKAFRPYQTPSFNSSDYSVNPCTIKVKDNKLSYIIKLSSSNIISAITINYSLKIGAGSSDEKNYSKDDKGELAKEQPFVKIIGKTNADDSGTEYPKLADGELPVYLSLGDNKTVTVKFGKSKRLASDYPRLEYIILQNRYEKDNETLELTINKIMLFNAEAVNISAEQLPCGILQYAFVVDFDYTPSMDAPLLQPQPMDNINPNFHVKIFNPDDTMGQIGFSHSMSLKFMIFSIPATYGQGGFTAAGAVAGLAYATSFYTQFLGPVAGTRNLNFALIPKPSNDRVVALDKYEISTGMSSIILQKAKDYTSSTIPPNTTVWEDLITYPIPASPIVPPPSVVTSQIVREFLYADINSNKNSWYKVVQSNVVTQTNMPVFQGEPYLEKTINSMVNASSPSSSDTGTITRRVHLDENKNPLDFEPLAIFIAQDDEPLSSPIKFTKGQWSVRFAAQSLDENNYVNTHIFARFWFRKGSNINVNNPLTGDDVEFYFGLDNSGKTTLIMGTPTSMDQVMLTPPLPQNMTNFELIRYIEGVTGTGITSGNGSYSWTNTFGVDGTRLVMALYMVSYLTPEGKDLKPTTANSPKFALKIAGDYASIDTTINQTLSQQFELQRAAKYTSSQYVLLSSPLNLSNKRMLEIDLKDTDRDYALYEKTFTSSSGDKKVDNAYEGLLLFHADEAPVEMTQGICIPYAEISLTKNNSAIVYLADFCTSFKTLAYGRIGTEQTWDIEIKLDSIQEQNDNINIDYALEAFLVSIDGTVSERIFRAFPSSSSVIDINFSVTIETPFLISGQNTQLVMRLISYPYYKDNKTLDLTGINAILNTEANGYRQVGTRINSFTLLHHTLYALQINQGGDSTFGSPSYYEKLPLKPTRALSGDDFNFIVAKESQLNQAITFPDIAMPISGAFYSPIWYVNFPADMEVRFSAIPLASESIYQNLRFRTVPSAGGVSSADLSISAAEDTITGTVSIVHDDTYNPEKDAQGTTGNIPDQVIRRRTLYSPGNSFGENTQLIRDSKGNLMSGFNSHVAYVNLDNQKSGKSGILGIIAEDIGKQYNDVNSMLDVSYGLSPQGLDPVRDLMSNNFGSMRKLAEGLSYPVMLQPNNSSNLYIVGWSDPGVLILKELTIWDSRSDGSGTDGLQYVVDGEPNVVLPSGDKLIYPEGLLNGKVSKTYPAILMTNRGAILVAYALEGKDGVLYGRISYDAKGFGVTQELVSFRKMGVTASSDLAIYGPALCHDNGMDINYVAFYCGGKIFLTCLSGLGCNNGVIISPLRLVAGSRDFTSQSNSANSVFATMVSTSNLIVDQDGELENDVPQQRVGFIVSGKYPYSSGLYIYYKDSNDKYNVRQVYLDGKVSKPLNI